MSRCHTEEEEEVLIKHMLYMHAAGDFEQLLRHHQILPEGGNEKLVLLIQSLLTEDGEIDYMQFLSSFGALGSQVQLANPDASLKAKLDREFGASTPHHASAENVAGGGRDGADAVKNLNARSKEMAFGLADLSVHWQVLLLLPLLKALCCSCASRDRCATASVEWTDSNAWRSIHLNAAFE